MANGTRGRPKGLPKTGGRKKGTPNKINTDLRGMIIGALSDVGGREYLARQAEENPAAFMSLVGRVLPREVVGEGGGPIQVKTVERVIVKNNETIDTDG